MNRLIRDTDLIEELELWKSLSDNSEEVCDVLATVIDMVDNQPTAYDVEAVVRELEEAIMPQPAITGEAYNAGLYKAIEIVKQGGRNG